jgi:hypothetical protein
MNGRISRNALSHGKGDGIMKYAMTLSAVLVLFMTACLPGIQGGVVQAGDEEAVPEHSETTYVYSGQRGVSVGVHVPDYMMSKCTFNDAILQYKIPNGWRLLKYSRPMSLVNDSNEGVISFLSSRYPDLHVVTFRNRVPTYLEIDPGPLDFNRDARHTTEFSAILPSKRELFVLGFVPSTNRPFEGVVISADAKAGSLEQLRRDVLSISRSFVIKQRR